MEVSSFLFFFERKKNEEEKKNFFSSLLFFSLFFSFLFSFSSLVFLVMCGFLFLVKYRDEREDPSPLVLHTFFLSSFLKKKLHGKRTKKKKKNETKRL